MFQLRNSQEYMATFYDKKHWHPIDHVLANKNAKQHITKVNLQANCFADHKLLVCKFSKFAIKQKGVKTSKKT